MSQHDTDSGGLGWWAGERQCVICHATAVCVVPHVVSDLATECPNCGQTSMTEMIDEQPESR